MKKRLQDGSVKEYDAVAIAGDKLMEVKNSKGFRPKEW